jgi:predicted nucleotidyltransferase/plasmid maintenance system antidote protein VapI
LTIFVKFKYVKMSDLGSSIKKLREAKKLPLRVVAAFLDIDQAILSKAEHGKRKLTREQVIKLAEYFGEDKDHLLVAWLSDKFVYEMQDEDLALQALKVAEERVGYNQFIKDPVTIFEKIKEALKKDSRIAEAWLFGSYARGEQKPGSDIDLIVKFAENRKISLFDFADIAHTLQISTKRKIDLVEKDCIEPFAWDTAKNDLIKIYG